MTPWRRFSRIACSSWSRDAMAHCTTVSSGTPASSWRVNRCAATLSRLTRSLPITTPGVLLRAHRQRRLVAARHAPAPRTDPRSTTAASPPARRPPVGSGAGTGIGTATGTSGRDGGVMLAATRRGSPSACPCRRPLRSAGRTALAVDAARSHGPAGGDGWPQRALAGGAVLLRPWLERHVVVRRRRRRARRVEDRLHLGCDELVHDVRRQAAEPSHCRRCRAARGDGHARPLGDRDHRRPLLAPAAARAPGRGRPDGRPAGACRPG